MATLYDSASRACSSRTSSARRRLKLDPARLEFLKCKYLGLVGID